jgi:hypothetical protein
MHFIDGLSFSQLLTQKSEESRKSKSGFLSLALHVVSYGSLSRCWTSTSIHHRTTATLLYLPSRPPRPLRKPTPTSNFGSSTSPVFAATDAGGRGGEGSGVP